MKTILVVDDSKKFRQILIESLKEDFIDAEFLETSDGLEAIKKIKEQAILGRRINLVITDIGMPNMNGLQLLSFLTLSHKDIPVIVLSNYSTFEYGKAVEELGGKAFFNKDSGLIEIEEKMEELLGQYASSQESALDLSVQK